jgi:hypothetical protein
MMTVAGNDLSQIQEALARIAEQSSSTQDWQAFMQELGQFGEAISLMRNVRDAQVQAMNEQNPRWRSMAVRTSGRSGRTSSPKSRQENTQYGNL